MKVISETRIAKLDIFFFIKTSICVVLSVVFIYFRTQDVPVI